MIKAWEFDFNQVPGKDFPDYHNQDTVQRAFDFNIDLLSGLERRGFEGIFCSEHHFIASMSPCPNLILSAVAAKTKTLKMGVMGNVLGFHQPWRLAEELHMLDYLTHGRLEIGFAVGIPPEFEILGIDPKDIRPMFAEIRDYLENAKENRFATLKGKYFDLEAIPSMPRPRKEERRRTWLTIYSENSCRDAARRSYKVCTGYQSCDDAKKAFDGYRDEADRNGISVGPDDIGLRRQVLVWDTQSEAEALFKEHAAAGMARMDATFNDVYQRKQELNQAPTESQRESGAIDAAVVPQLDEAAPKSAASELSKILSQDEFITGSPENVAEQIIDQCRRTGAGHIMGYHASTFDYEQIEHNYRLWEKVIPILKTANVV